MADPITWLAIGSAVFSAAGSIQQGRQADAAGQSQANMDNYNAEMSTIRATQANAAAGRQEDQQRKQARQAIGMQLASSAEAGAGLNGDLLRQSVFDAESDTQAIRYEGQLKAQGLSDDAAIARSSAIINRDRGKQARNASYLNAAGSLLNAGAKSYGAK